MINSTVDSQTEEEIALTAILGTIVYLGGLIGNLLSLMIFIRIEIRKVSTGLLFLFLTISNSLQLLTLIIEFIDVVYNVRLFSSVFIRCRLLYWFQNIFRSLSSFIACTICFDRMFRAVYPSRAKRYCTCGIAWRIVLFYFLFFALSFTFYLFPYMKDNTDGICSLESNLIYYQFMTSIWPPIRTILVCILPVLIMIITNILLWRRIRASKRRIAPRNSSNLTKTETMLIFITISNVLAFILTQIPFHIYTTLVSYQQKIDHIRTPILLWSSLYFGIGFYIYCLTSKYFRSKFMLTIRWCLKREDRINMQRNTIS